jgi:hypothetical protein
MAKLSTKTSGKSSTRSATARTAGVPRRAKRKTLTALNAWMSANYAGLVKEARKNCLHLTGRPTFGGNGRGRKSA